MDMDEDSTRKLERNLSAFKEMAEIINMQIQPMVQMSVEVQKSIETALAPAITAIELVKQRSKEISEQLRITFEIIRKIQENHKEGKEIRGEIVTSIIDLDKVLEEIILRKYVKNGLHDEFTQNMLNDESCSSFLKYKVVARSGLIDQEVKKNIQILIEIRNIIVHSKYRPTIQTIEILHKEGVKDIQTLKNQFDSIFGYTITKLEEVLKTL